ncbi:MAG: TauD/TfdA family dioxygenase [Magnetovibrio sp.]|nr:TauD/TfdA family dioxygenase [Magnetovibrio sp.]
MSLEIKPITPILGAEVSGVDLSRPLSNAEFDAVHRAFVTHSLLVFRDQNLSPEAQIEFSRRFGPLMVHVLKGANLEDHPEIYRVSNVKKDGKTQGRSYAGQYWHSDLTYEPRPSLGSLLYGLEVPEFGGDTLFASTAHAFETLSPTMQAMLDGLTAEHHFAHAFRGGANPAARKGDPLDERPPVRHPVVRTHPETGRKCVFVNEGFTVRIIELEPKESEAVLGFLCQHMTRSQVVLRHRWRTGDAVLWDNRALVHRAVDDYGDDQPRHMHRTTIEDTD